MLCLAYLLGQFMPFFLFCVCFLCVWFFFIGGVRGGWGVDLAVGKTVGLLKINFSVS